VFKHKFFKLLLETTLATINARVLTLIKKGLRKLHWDLFFPHHINFIRRSLRASTGALSQITLSGRAFPPVEFSRITHFELISDFGDSCKDVMDKCLYLSTLLCYPPHVNLVSLIFPHSICLSIASPSPLFLSFHGPHFQNRLSRGQTLFICIATFRRFIFIIFLLLEFFSSLLNQIWDLKIFSIKVWGSIPLFISRGRISPLASFHLVEIVDPTLPYDMLF